MRSVVTIGAILFLVPALASAQTESAPTRPSVFSDYLNVQAPGSLLRIPGLSFSSSAGFSFFSGGGMSSVGMGYYMGHFGLKLSDSITLHWDVGVGSFMRSASDYEQPRLFLPNFDLTYRPSDSFTVRFQFQQYRWPGYYQIGR